MILPDLQILLDNMMTLQVCLPVISMTKFIQEFIFSGKNLKYYTDILIGIIISVCADIKQHLLEEILTFQLNSLSIKFQTF